MRALLFALVLANLAFFGWAHWVDAPEVAASAPVQDKSVPTLALASTATTRATGSLRCRTLGPFANQAATQATAAILRARGIGTHDRTVERSVEDGYWVYISDIGSAADQQRAMVRLQKGGITDASIMTDAEDAGRISVGVFSEQARAVRRAEQVRSLGFKPILDLHQRVQHVFWLDMELKAEQPEPPVKSLQSAIGEPGTAGRGIAFGDCPVNDNHG